MSLRKLAIVCGVCVLFVGVGSTAKAQFGWGGGLGFGVYNSTYSLEPPPYFSVYPPVYYSHITPRPYGFSPYAYPGFMPTPERIRMPSTPYVPSAARQPIRRPTSAQTTAVPITIKNPFVLPEADRPERLADGRPLPQKVSLQETAIASGAARTALDK